MDVNKWPSSIRSTKPATRHWFVQRITAIILIPLSFHLIVFLNLCLSSPYPETKAWLAGPENTALLVAWLVAVFYHAALGVQVVIEDYVADATLQALLIKVVNLSFLVLTVAALIFMFRSV
jgi:succinate dehydrogenase / fumarate reductase, membrane anchor subunit